MKQKWYTTTSHDVTIRISQENDIDWSIVPSTIEVNNVTAAAFRLPAGRFIPILSSLSLKKRPPFLDLALEMNDCCRENLSCVQLQRI